MLAALVRARFCELLSPKINHGDSDLFLMGLLSLMDTMLEVPMHQVLDNVHIDQESKVVLLGGVGRLRPFYQLMLAQEAGDWKSVSELTRQLHLDESDVATFYLQAMQWAREVTAGPQLKHRASSAEEIDAFVHMHRSTGSDRDLQIGPTA